VKSSMIGILGQMAVYSGKQIGWDEALQSNFTFGPPIGDFNTKPPVLPDEEGNYPVPVPGKTKVI